MFTMETAQLIERCMQGDEAALGELYTAYAQRMKGVCRRYIHDEQAVEDVLHDAFVIIFTSFDRLRDTAKAEAWMMAIVRNVASKYKDHLNALPTTPLEETEAISVTEEPEDATLRGIPFAEVMTLVDKLPVGYRNVFRLSVFEGLSHKEIAETLGIEPHSSSSQLARAKKMLRKMMRQYWGVFLLLLIPVALYLHRGKSKNGIEKPIATQQKPSSKQSKHNDRERIHEQRKTPTTPTLLPLSIDSLKILFANTSDSIAVSDTLSHNIAEESMPDTLPHTPTFPPHSPILQHDLANLIPDKPTRNKNRQSTWSLELAYTGQHTEQNKYNQPYNYIPPQPPSDVTSEVPTLPSSIDNWNDYVVYLANHPEEGSPEVRKVLMQIALNNAEQPDNEKMLRSSHHSMPITWSLALKHQLSKHWGIETGLTYSRLTSEFEIGTDGNTINEQQTIHYVGIPLKGIYNMYQNKSWSFYGSMGMSVELPAYAPLHTHYYLQDHLKATDKSTLHTPWQFSTSLGFGMQYHITPHIGIFAEPSLQYHLPTNSNIETYRTEHPFTVTFPIGIRFTW